MLDFTIWFRQGKSHSSRTYLWNTFTLRLFPTLSSLVFLKTHGNGAGQFYPKCSKEGVFSGGKKKSSTLGLLHPELGVPGVTNILRTRALPRKYQLWVCLGWARGICHQHWGPGTRKSEFWLPFLYDHGFKGALDKFLGAMGSAHLSSCCISPLLRSNSWWRPAWPGK